jgi:hypothetical protein
VSDARTQFRVMRAEWIHWRIQERLLPDRQWALNPDDYAAWERTVKERLAASWTLYRAAFAAMNRNPAA